jgi:hypothetical protein
VFWIRKTIRKVTIVVPVLMTSCHVSENRKIGPVTAQTTMTVMARRNAHFDPSQNDALAAKRPKRSADGGSTLVSATFLLMGQNLAAE